MNLKQNKLKSKQSLFKINIEVSVKHTIKIGIKTKTIVKAWNENIRTND